MAASMRQFSLGISINKTNARLFISQPACIPMVFSKICGYYVRPIFLTLTKNGLTPNNISFKVKRNCICSAPNNNKRKKLTLNFHTIKKNLLMDTSYQYKWWQEETARNNSRIRSGSILAMGIMSFFFPKNEDDVTIEKTIASAIHQERKGNVHEAEKQLHQALEMSLKENNQQGVTYIYDQLANLHLRHGKLEQAEASFKETLRRLISSGTEKDDPAIIEISLKLAEIYSATRKVNEAQQGFRWCVATTEEKIKASQKDSSTADDSAYQTKELIALLGMCLEAYARFLSRNKQYDMAEKLYLRALAICENDLVIDGKPHIESVTILSDLGTLYDRKGEYNKAKEYIRRAATLAPRLGDTEAMPYILCNLGAVEDHLGNRLEAMRLFKKALAQAESQGDTQSILVIKNKIAQLQTDMLLKKK